MNRRQLDGLILLWYFMTIVPAQGAGAPTNLVATQGPFVSAEQCEWGRQYLGRLKVVASPCWSDGQ